MPLAAATNWTSGRVLVREWTNFLHLSTLEFEPECNPPHTFRPDWGSEMTEVAEPTTVPGDLAAFPMKRTCPFAPPPAYEQMRAEGPITQVELPSGQIAWALTRMEDIRAML